MQNYWLSLSKFFGLYIVIHSVFAGEIQESSPTAAMQRMDHILEMVEKTETRFAKNLKEYNKRISRIEKQKGWEKKLNLKIVSKFKDPYRHHPVTQELIQTPLQGINLTSCWTALTVGTVLGTAGALTGAALGLPFTILKLKLAPTVVGGVIGFTAGGLTGATIGGCIGVPTGCILGTVCIPITMTSHKIRAHYRPTFFKVAKKMYKAHKKISTLETLEADNDYKEKKLEELENKFYELCKLGPLGSLTVLDSKITRQLTKGNEEKFNKLLLHSLNN